jgi:hypothetical protein
MRARNEPEEELDQQNRHRDEEVRRPSSITAVTRPDTASP